MIKRPGCSHYLSYANRWEKEGAAGEIEVESLENGSNISRDLEAFQEET